MSLFRLASRDLFNNFFRHSCEDLALIDEGFKEVQNLLFRKLVIQPFALPDIEYGDENEEISVNILGWLAPAMINRERNSGYWDYPIKEITQDAKLCFVGFFDFSTIRLLDHQFVEVCIRNWPAYPELVGKRTLIEYRYVQFSLSKQN